MEMEDQKNSQDRENERSVPTAGYGGGAVGPGEQIGPYKLLRILGEEQVIYY